jgi:hypothetical protein
MQISVQLTHPDKYLDHWAYSSVADQTPARPNTMIAHPQPTQIDLCGLILRCAQAPETQINFADFWRVKSIVMEALFETKSRPMFRSYVTKCVQRVEPVVQRRRINTREPGIQDRAYHIFSLDVYVKADFGEEWMIHK